MRLLDVAIFVRRRSNAHSNAAGFWVSSGPSNAFILSAVDHTIFDYVQS
jgi:hypothetical protein